METKTIAVDFGQNDIYPKIEKGLSGLEIGVLGERTVLLPKAFFRFIYKPLLRHQKEFILDISSLKCNDFTWSCKISCVVFSEIVMVFFYIALSRLISNALSPPAGDSWNHIRNIKFLFLS